MNEMYSRGFTHGMIFAVVVGILVALTIYLQG